MLIPRFVVGMFSVASMVLGAAGSSGQDYPKKPIRIVTTGIGGGSDLASRIIAQGISGPLGQPVVVDNRPTGLIAAEVVAKAPPDGYTMVLYSASLWVRPLLQETSYDPVRDFSPISLIASAPLLLVVHPSVPAKSVKELIALAKAKPGALNYGSAGLGTPPHLAVELFKSLAGVDIVHIPFKSSGPSVIGLLRGETQMTMDTGPSQIPHIKSGKLRALAVTSVKPSALFPGLPTVAETVPGHEAVLVHSILVPAKTPATIVSRLNQEIVRVLNRPEVKEMFFKAGTETVGSSPGELATIMKSEMVRVKKLIKDAGLKLE